MVSVSIDYREYQVINLCESNNFEYKEKNLNVGDILIEREYDGLTYIIERKTMDDFSASIIDGRYREQKERLKESGAYVIYIIENFIKTHTKGVKHDTLLSAMFMMQRRDNIHIIRTENINETFKYIEILSRKILEDGNNNKSIISFNKKSSNNDTFMSMLLCIHGISNSVASIIKTHYKSIKDIVLYIQNCEKSDELKFTHINKIGKVLSKRICDSFNN